MRYTFVDKSRRAQHTKKKDNHKNEQQSKMNKSIKTNSN